MPDDIRRVDSFDFFLSMYNFSDRLFGGGGHNPPLDAPIILVTDDGAETEAILPIGLFRPEIAPDFRHGEWTLADAIDALHAHDDGAWDSGVSDPALRRAVRDYLRGLPGDDHRRVVGRVVRELCLSEDALADGYGPEDARKLMYWLEDLACE